MRMRRAFSVAVLLAGLAALPARAMDYFVEDNGEGCASCRWILGYGLIQPGEAEKLQAFIAAKTPRTTNMRFLSPGGDLGAALELGVFLRARGFDTFVGDADHMHRGFIGRVHTMQRSLCYSACAYAFAGGVHRHADEKTIGIHEFSRVIAPVLVSTGAELNDGAEQAMTERLDDYLAAMGVDPALAALAASVSPMELKLLDTQQLAALNLDNSSAPR